LQDQNKEAMSASVTHRASNGWLHQGCSSAPPGAAFGEYIEKRQMHPLYTLHQIRCKRPELSQLWQLCLAFQHLLLA